MVEMKHVFIAVCVLALAFVAFMATSASAASAAAYGRGPAGGGLAGGNGAPCGPQGCVGMALGDPSLKDFVIKATKFAFSPSTIAVNKGDRVRLTLQNVDGAHGLSISEYGVNLQPGSGQSQTAEFVADKAGTFNFACTVYCGSGHLDMSGKLVVDDAAGSQAQAPAPAPAPAPVVQEIRLHAGAYGYDNPVLYVKAGQPVKFDFSADASAGCGRQVIIDGVGVNLISRNGETVSATFTAPKPGQYAYHCGMNMFRGVLTAS
ncbi:MAG: cupredoxin domain-containing protein [Candidatus Micrarchaeota archaeon]